MASIHHASQTFGTKVQAKSELYQIFCALSINSLHFRGCLPSAKLGLCPPLPPHLQLDIYIFSALLHQISSSPVLAVHVWVMKSVNQFSFLSPPPHSQHQVFHVTLLCTWPFLRRHRFSSISVLSVLFMKWICRIEYTFTFSVFVA